LLIRAGGSGQREKKRISNLEQGMSNDEVKNSLACFVRFCLQLLGDCFGLAGFIGQLALPRFYVGFDILIWRFLWVCLRFAGCLSLMGLLAGAARRL
jgi:hypothetical protein